MSAKISDSPISPVWLPNCHTLTSRDNVLARDVHIIPRKKQDKDDACPDLALPAAAQRDHAGDRKKAKDGKAKQYAQFPSFEALVSYVAARKSASHYIMLGHTFDPTLVYIDIDRHDTVYSPDAVYTQLSAAFTQFMSERYGMSYVLVPGENCQVSAVLTSPCNPLTSLHLVLYLRISSLAGLQLFAQSLSEWIMEFFDVPELKENRDGVLCCIVDTSVYSCYRLFRCLYQTKFGEDRDLEPFVGSSPDVALHCPNHPKLLLDESIETLSITNVQPAKISIKRPSQASGCTYDCVTASRLLNSEPSLKENLCSGPSDEIRVRKVTHLDHTIRYDLVDAKCMYAGRTHTHNTGLVYLLESLSVGKKVIHHMCRDPVCVRKRDEIGTYTLEVNKSLITSMHDVAKLTSMHSQEDNISWSEDYDEPSMRPYPLERIVCIRANMGVGKTVALKQFVIQHCSAPSCKALLITFSRSLAHKLYQDFADLGFVDYRDEKGDLFDAKLVICLDSLVRVQVRDYDFVFIDEALSVFLHFSTPLMKNSSHVSTLLELLLRTSKHVYFLDACMDATVVRNIVEFLAIKASTQAYWIRNRHVRVSARTVYCEIEHGGQTAVLDETGLERAAIDKVVKLLRAGLRVVVCSSTLAFTTTVEKYIADTMPQVRMIVHNKLSKESLDDVNGKWVHYDLLIYSPSISAGVSFTVPHFDSLVAYLVNSPFTPSVDTSLQQLFRVRALRRGDMSLFVQEAPNNVPLPMTDSEVDEYLAKDANTLNRLVGKDVNFQLQIKTRCFAEDGKVQQGFYYDTDSMSYQVLKGIVMMRHRSQSHYTDLLLTTLCNDYGIECTRFDRPHKSELEVEYEADMSALVKAKAVVTAVPFDLIDVIPEAGRAQYDALCSRIETASPEDLAAKMLYERAYLTWGIPESKVSESFYHDYVAHSDAPLRLMRARRYRRAMLYDLAANRSHLAQQMKKLTQVDTNRSDRNLDIYKNRLRDNYHMLLLAQQLLQGCVPDYERLKREKVVVPSTHVQEAYMRFRSSLSADETDRLKKLFELQVKKQGDDEGKEVKPCIAVRKVMDRGLGITADRQSSRSNKAGYRTFQFEAEEHTDMCREFCPKLLADLVPV